MTHTEYWLTVDGAHEADILVDESGKVVSNGDPGSSPTTLDEWLETLADDAHPFGVDGGIEYRVYKINHGDHDLSAECECAQFETDHHPIWTAGGQS